MKFFPLLISGMLLFSIVSCSSTERATSNESDLRSEETEEETQPDWYNNSVTSVTDSTGFTGYALAAAVGREEAQSLSEESAVINLKFEIDRFAERVRRDLAESSSGSAFSSPSFIRDLRNAVQSLSVEDANSETEIFSKGNVHHAYTKITLSINHTAERLSQQINNSEFISAFRQQP